MTEYRNKLVRALDAARKQLPEQQRRVLIPALAPNMPGQQHEITCVSLVILNTHAPKTSRDHRRKKLIVLYNNKKVVTGNRHPEADDRLAADGGLDDVTRISFYPCSGELALLKKTFGMLRDHGIELLYLFNAEFDVCVIEQRVHFYAELSRRERLEDVELKRECASLLQAWHCLFVTRALAKDAMPFFQFENVRYLDMYREMLMSVGSLLLRGAFTERKLHLVAAGPLQEEQLRHERRGSVQGGGDQRDKVYVRQHEPEQRRTLCHSQGQGAARQTSEGRQKTVQVGGRRLFQDGRDDQRGGGGVSSPCLSTTWSTRSCAPGWPKCSDPCRLCSTDAEPLSTT